LPFSPGRHALDSGRVNALWGKLPGVAVTKCIVLKEVERQKTEKPAGPSYFRAFASRSPRIRDVALSFRTVFLCALAHQSLRDNNGYDGMPRACGVTLSVTLSVM
jgi:hypothetical protein